MIKALLVAACCSVACIGTDASARPNRAVSDAEVRHLIDALLREPAAALSEDPSCKADLASPGAMSIAQGFGVALLRAATHARPLSVIADCFVRSNYPLGPGQEYCRIGFASRPKPRVPSYGLLFVMDWPKKSVVAGTVECF